MPQPVEELTSLASTVKAVTVPTVPLVQFSRIVPTDHFDPVKVKRAVITLFEELHPPPNPNRGRLSGTARSLTFGAQTGRGFRS